MKTGTKASTKAGLLHWGLPAPVIETMLALGLAFALSMPLAGLAPQPAAADERPLEHFSRLPHFTDPELSPDGQRVAYFMTVSDTGDTVLVVQQLDSGEVKPLLVSGNTQARISWFSWANNERILVSMRFADNRGSTDTRETRLVSINADDPDDVLSLYRPRNTSLSGSRRRREHFSQFQDQIVSLLRNDPEHILLALDIDKPGEPSVFRVNVYDSNRQRVENGRRQIRDWWADRQGRVRIGIGLDYDRGEVTIYYRQADDDDWGTLFEYDMFEHADDIDIRGFDADPDILYYTAYNRGLKALYKIDLVSKQKTLVHADPEYDVIPRLLRSPVDERVVGIDDQGIITYWDERFLAQQQSLDRALPDFTNRIVSLSRDENIYLLRSRNSTTPAAYYLGNRRDKTLNLLAEEYPELGAEPRYQRQVLTYQARDGEEIEAVLSLPQGSDGPLPAILFPHGGPHTRQSRAFDYRVAFFTDRGYAVLSPDFRGSAGYGYQFGEARMRGWGLQMQDDLTDAARWLVERGTADPNRMCIVGGSYGGYAALMGAVKTPDLFRCAVSINGVSDLSRLVASQRRYLQSNVAQEEIGNRRSDLRARSPYHNAEQIRIPILLLHGEDDRVVDVSQSRRMADRLRNEGKQVQYIELPDGDHYLSAQANRHEFFRTMDTFLKRHLGP